MASTFACSGTTKSLSYDPVGAMKYRTGGRFANNPRASIFPANRIVGNVYLSIAVTCEMLVLAFFCYVA